MNVSSFDNVNRINFNSVRGEFDVSAIHPDIYANAYGKLKEMIDTIHSDTKCVELFRTQMELKVKLFRMMLVALAVLILGIIIYFAIGEVELGVFVLCLAGAAIVLAVVYYCYTIDRFKSRVEYFKLRAPQIVNDYNQKHLFYLGWEAEFKCEISEYNDNVNRLLLEIYVDVKKRGAYSGAGSIVTSNLRV